MPLFLLLCFVCVCVHMVSDREAAPASETQRAQASVSDASLIRVESFISASPSMDSRSVCQVSFGSVDLTWLPAPGPADECIYS